MQYWGEAASQQVHRKENSSGRRGIATRVGLEHLRSCWVSSPVYGHFGLAPGFVIVDTQTSGVEEIENSDLHHAARGMCQPFKALGAVRSMLWSWRGLARGH